MSRTKSVVVSLVALACVAAVGIGARQVAERRPSDANLRAAIERELALISDAQPRYCVRAPLDYPAPDARSKLRRFGGYAEFIKEAPAKGARERQMTQLDALAQAGLLTRRDVVLPDAASAGRPAWRYELSTKGWIATRRDGCMQYGLPSLLRIVEKKELDHRGTTVQSVRARIAPAPDTLAEWARDPRVVAAFPELAQAAEGRDEQFLLAWQDGRWQQFHEPGTTMPPIERLPADEQKRLKKLATLPDATREELVALVSRFPHQGCLRLPGSEKLPADQVLYADKEHPYRFAVYQDKQRQVGDRVGSKTMPVIDRLVRIGALVQLPDQTLAGPGLDRGQVFHASIYELSPVLQALTQPQSNCVSFGPLTHDIVDLQYRKTNRWGYPIASFTFKKIVRFKTPPAALTDPVLLGAWPDLRESLESGTACEGEFQFNRETRGSEAGSASCWDAFDSYYENH